MEYMRLHSEIYNVPQSGIYEAVQSQVEYMRLHGLVEYMRQYSLEWSI